MSPVGWEPLGQWGEDVARIEPLAGGVANDVWSGRVHGRLAVGRLGARGDADLAWETELLQYLDRQGLTVPVPIPTRDGRLFVDGLVVMTYVEGGPPETEADRCRVADMLRRLHRLTQGWPQRPGWRSSPDLLHAETGTKIDLGAMPFPWRRQRRCSAPAHMLQNVALLMVAKTDGAPVPASKRIRSWPALSSQRTARRKLRDR
jgi:Ser/Thr protein kinase RdoA (MazF antagonist)